MDDIGAQVVTLAGSCFCPGSAPGWATPWWGPRDRPSKLTARGIPNGVSFGPRRSWRTWPFPSSGPQSRASGVPVCRRLSAGGRWIRTLGPQWGKLRSRDCPVDRHGISVRPQGRLVRERDSSNHSVRGLANLWRILWCKSSNSGSRELLSGAGLTACDVPWFSANSPPPSSGDGDEGVRALESQTAAE